MATAPSYAPPTARWQVAPGSGFLVGADDGLVDVVQIDRREFQVRTRFEFDDPAVLQTFRRRLVEKHGDGVDVEAMLNTARTWDNPTDTTDFASVPQFLGWFERPYGRHTLAAVLHDQLIVPAANAGALGSDQLADDFFRDMIKSVGVPLLKRWLMWAAVVGRSRWAAKGRRRLGLVMWALVGLAAIATSAVRLVGAVAGSNTWAAAGVTVVVSLVVGMLASVLWGRQWFAGFVAAVVGIWLIPASATVLAGLVVYCASEKVLRRFFPHDTGDELCLLDELTS